MSAFEAKQSSMKQKVYFSVQFQSSFDLFFFRIFRDSVSNREFFLAFVFYLFSIALMT